MYQSAALPKLPEGYDFPDEEQKETLHAELQRELPPGHLLHNVPVRTFALRGATDDVLFQHCHEPARFTAVHLTWRGVTEIDANHPAVEFDGSFADFLADEQERYGL